MRPSILKQTSKIEIFTKLNEYAIKHSSGSSEKYNSFFQEMQQNRNVITKVGNLLVLSSSHISQQRFVLSSYINQLIILKSKMLFGKESYNCAIEFVWTDTIKENKWKSYNIYFEYYNTLFNLGVIYPGTEMGVGAVYPLSMCFLPLRSFALFFLSH